MEKFSPLYCLRIYLGLSGWSLWEMPSNLLNSLGVIKSRKFAHLPDSLKGKIVAITGGNTGIGKETAKAIVKRGGKVLLACRSQTRAQEAIDDIVQLVGEEARPNLIFVELDLSSMASVRKAAATINHLVAHIDVLINNAGVMWTPEWKTADGYEFQFGTNHLGHFLLTQLLIDKIKLAPAGSRIVNVSALLHMPGQMYWDNLNMTKAYSPFRAYARSKLANIYFTREMAKKLGPESRIKVYALHPGVINTELSRHVVSVSSMQSLRKYVTITPEEGAQTTLYCAFDEAVANETGQYYDNCARVDKLWPHVTDAAAAERLWDLSLKLCDVDDHF